MTASNWRRPERTSPELSKRWEMFTTRLMFSIQNTTGLIFPRYAELLLLPPRYWSVIHVDCELWTVCNNAWVPHFNTIKHVSCLSFLLSLSLGNVLSLSRPGHISDTRELNGLNGDIFWTADSCCSYLQWTAIGPVLADCSWWARACSTRPSRPWVELGTWPASSVLPGQSW